MLLTISLVIAGLSTGQKLGIAAAGAAFIVFALICSFVLPKRSPNFPGRHMGWYIVVVACFVIGMLAVVLTLGKEKPERRRDHAHDLLGDHDRDHDQPDGPG